MVRVRQSARLRAALGKRMAEARAAKGITQDDLAKELGYSGGKAVCRWERGHNMPQAVPLLLAARVLGVDALWLLTGKDALSVGRN